jgi:hypothetical protein
MQFVGLSSTQGAGVNVWSTAGSLLTYNVGTQPVADTSFDPTKIITEPPGVTYVNAANTTLLSMCETEDGVSIGFNLSTGELRTDGFGVADITFGGLEVMARFKPVGMTSAAASQIAAFAWAGTSGYSIGKSFAGLGGTMTIAPLDATVSSPTIYIYGAVARKSGFKYGATQIRNDEMEFVANITSAAATAATNPLFKVT